ncbi:hypothetical protein HYC85_010121 [Camellia sinensis]|uniref:Uncharacterized protein n=1 Tax=Camellia sinensis TaxID=4442 RepID=A0A7J7HIG7_CAMSI|nr:hypothetical protein HYC85_010121 [Camellia sinensis]
MSKQKQSSTKETTYAKRNQSSCSKKWVCPTVSSHWRTWKSVAMSEKPVLCGLNRRGRPSTSSRRLANSCQYATEVTAYVEPNKIKKLTGVKTKELLLWITLSDIYVDDPPTGKITFQIPAGLSRTFPVSAFEVEEGPAKAEVGGGNVSVTAAAAAVAAQVKEV